MTGSYHKPDTLYACKPMNTLFASRCLTSLLFVTVMTSCTGNISIAQPSSTQEHIRAGATLVLNETIRFPAYSATVEIQNGQVRSGLFSLDKYYPNCTLELRSQSDSVRMIQADRFIIYKVTTGIEHVMNKPVVVAGPGFHIADGATDDAYITKMYLQSEKQKDVELMSCQHWEDPTSFPRHLTLKQIQQTLGSLFTIEIN